MNNDFQKAVGIINEMLKYGDHTGKCTNFIGGVHNRDIACTKHVNAAKRREKNAIKFLVSHGYIPGSSKF